MFLITTLTITAIISALHGWGRFRKGYSLPLMALCFCALLYITGTTHWYAGMLIAIAWRVLFRTGKIAQAENGAIQHSDGRSVLPAYTVGVIFSWLITLGYVFINAFHVQNALITWIVPAGMWVHQKLHDKYINYRYLSPARWYDATGRKFLDARRLSELSGGFFISGWFNYVLLLLVK